jgi:hypothetical protein
MNTRLVFLDAEFTSFDEPQLLSLGLVAHAGDEGYFELDLSSELGEHRAKIAGDFAREQVLPQWGKIPGSSFVNEYVLGRDLWVWLSCTADYRGRPMEIAFDHDTDYELFRQVLKVSGAWDRVSDFIVPVNISAFTSTTPAEAAAEKAHDEFVKRGFERHHALADAYALRGAYLAVQADVERYRQFIQTPAFEQLVTTASRGIALALDREPWRKLTRDWLTTESELLDGQRPLDLLEQPGGLATLEGILRGDSARSVSRERA